MSEMRKGWRRFKAHSPISTLTASPIGSRICGAREYSTGRREETNTAGWFVCRANEHAQSIEKLRKHIAKSGKLNCSLSYLTPRQRWSPTWIQWRQQAWTSQSRYKPHCCCCPPWIPSVGCYACIHTGQPRPQWGHNPWTRKRETKWNQAFHCRNALIINENYIKSTAMCLCVISQAEIWTLLIILIMSPLFLPT